MQFLPIDMQIFHPKMQILHTHMQILPIVMQFLLTMFAVALMTSFSTLLGAPSEPQMHETMRNGKSFKS